MAIDKGNIKTSANYDVRAQKPLDARAVRPTKADLITKSSWSADGNTVYAYEGMQVYVESEKKTYYLKDLSKMFSTDYSGWELIGTGATGGGGGSVDVDYELNENSTNPVANKVIVYALDTKVDKEYAKGLSANDFTNALRAKLESLNNYDDTAINNAINTLRNDVNTLLNGDPSEYIEKYNQIIAFLENLEDDTTLEGVIAAIQLEIGEKQDALVSGQNIKTINGQSILGSGNIEIEGGTAEIQIDDALDVTSPNAIQNKVVTAALNKKADLADLANKPDIRSLARVASTGEYGDLKNKPSFATINGQRIDTGAEITIAPEGTELPAFTIDTQMLDDSTNLVQNKVIKKYVDDNTALVIQSNKDFEVVDTESNVGVITDANITYDKVKAAVDNGNTIVLREPRGNVSYSIRADYALANSEGQSRILLYFTKNIGDVQYDLVIYVGLNSSLTYIISKNDALKVDDELTDTSTNPVQGKAIKEYVDTNRDVYIGTGTPPSSAKVWINPEAESPVPSVEIEVDMEMSDTSTNPVANKVVKGYVDEAVKNVPSGGGGSGAKVYVIPEGVMNAPLDGYMLTDEESADFLAQGDFSNTSAKAWTLNSNNEQVLTDITQVIRGDGYTSLWANVYTYGGNTGVLKTISVVAYNMMFLDTGAGIMAATNKMSGTINLQ